MTKAEQMLEFIEANLAKGLTIHICTSLKTISISPKTVAKFEKVGAKIFKIDSTGFLCVASGKTFNAICSPTISLP